MKAFCKKEDSNLCKEFLLKMDVKIYKIIFIEEKGTCNEFKEYRVTVFISCILD